MPDPDHGEQTTEKLITSEGLSKRAVATCWALALGLLISGVTATFLDKAGAAAATMLAIGGVLAVLALMRRIPLRLEVAGTKLDAAYPPDQAFDAGREDGVRQGLETAVKEAEEAKRSGQSVDELLEDLHARSHALSRFLDSLRLPAESQPTDGREFTEASEEHHPARFGYRAACQIADITPRQLDYWERTGLVESSAVTRSGNYYSEAEILILTIVKRLLDTGVSLAQIRSAVAHLRNRPSSDWIRLILIGDGESVYVATSRKELEDLLDRGHGVFVIAVGQVWLEVRHKLDAAYPERRPHGVAPTS